MQNWTGSLNTPLLVIHHSKICIIEVYLLKYYFEATSYINDAIIDNLQSMKYYGILRRYNWFMP